MAVCKGGQFSPSFNLATASPLCLLCCCSGFSHSYPTLSSFPGTVSCVSSSSPLFAVCYHLYELPLMRLSGEQTLAWGQRRRGLEWGKCPHPSSQYRALSGAQPLSAPGKCPGIADGGGEREKESERERDGQARTDLFSERCLSECVVQKLIESLPPVVFFVVWRV